jgi:tRNA(Arg) A34 adenosine deaminase TadA
MPSNENYINERDLRNIGIHQLKQVESSKNTKKIAKSLSKYQFHEEYSDDGNIWFTCIFALKAVVSGNFGIGALLTNSRGTIVAYGHNKVFNPYFRSDRHAEMVVLDQFEDEHRRTRKLGTFSLYTSLEPCPMCLARLITSGIGVVKYAAADPAGGMIHIMKNLPDVWLDLSRKRIFTTAECSDSLSEIAQEIFLLNADELNKKLTRRSG